MSDLDGPDARRALEADEVNLWIGEPELGLWCGRCALPSAWRAPIQRDPAEPPEMWVSGCTDCHRHPDKEAP